MMKIQGIAIRTTLLALVLTLPVLADASIDQNASAIRVDLSTVNLQVEEGQAAAYARLRDAAEHVCGAATLQQLGSIQRVMERRSCFDQSLQRAVERSGNEGLARLHQNS